MGYKTHESYWSMDDDNICIDGAGLHDTSSCQICYSWEPSEALATGDFMGQVPTSKSGKVGWFNIQIQRNTSAWISCYAEIISHGLTKVCMELNARWHADGRKLTLNVRQAWVQAMAGHEAQEDMQAWFRLQSAEQFMYLDLHASSVLRTLLAVEHQPMILSWHITCKQHAYISWKIGFDSQGCGGSARDISATCAELVLNAHVCGNQRQVTRCFNGAGRSMCLI